MDKKDKDLLRQAVLQTQDAFAGNFSGISEIVHVDPASKRKTRINLEAEQSHEREHD